MRATVHPKAPGSVGLQSVWLSRDVLWPDY